MSLRQTVDFRPDFLSDNCAEESHRSAVENGDRQYLADLAAVALEHDDAIVRAAADELGDGALVARLFRKRAASIVLISAIELLGPLAGAFNKNFDRAADKRLVILFADLILHGQ